jgi:hypothetical protein
MTTGMESEMQPAPDIVLVDDDRGYEGLESDWGIVLPRPSRGARSAGPVQR